MNGLRIIKSPHLPQGKVGVILIGERYRSKLETALKSRSVDVLWVPDNQNVDSRLCGHVDLSFIHTGGDVIIGQKNNVNILTNMGFVIKPADNAQSPDHPRDVGLNGCIICDYFIHSTAYTDPMVLKNLRSRKIINVSQGYAKCSICIVDDNSIITADNGIADAAAAHGIDVLKISPGHIALDGFDYGFIGGSTFKLSSHELAFTGTLKSHPDRDLILNFLQAKNISPVFLTADPIFDIGSAIPLFER